MSSDDQSKSTRPVSQGPLDAQRVEWDAYVARCHSQGTCEFSGMFVTECVQTICDCFESPEGAAEIMRRAGL